LAAANADGEVDWTTSKCVNAVKNQGQCGSCWAFSGTGTVESAHCIATGTLLNLSDQQVTSCAKAAGNGCDGGLEDKAITWIHDNGGLCLEKDYPYTSGSSGQTGSCQSSCSKQKLSIGATVNIKGEGALETALNTQPISVAVEAGNDVWQYYKGGVVTHCPGAQSDHAVIAVGYGSENGKNFFKIRNSWGANWGEKGYIRLQRGVGGKGMCNVAEEPAYPKISVSPTSKPTDAPYTPQPTGNPTNSPTSNPTNAPTDSPSDDPTDEPSDDPTDKPSDDPTDEPSNDPTDEPSDDPTDEPSNDPTEEPSDDPTEEPSDVPTDKPSDDPTDEPSNDPTDEPSDDPTDEPSDDPTDEPSNDPTDAPTEYPTEAPDTPAPTTHAPCTRHPKTHRPHTHHPKTHHPKTPYPTDSGLGAQLGEPVYG
ncbi:cysteine protease family C01A, partial [Thraustotheca clavata]